MKNGFWRRKYVGYSFGNESLAKASPRVSAEQLCFLSSKYETKCRFGFSNPAKSLFRMSDDGRRLVKF